MLFFLLDEDIKSLSQLKACIKQMDPQMDIRTFRASEDALKALYEQNLFPDVLFCEVEMERGDGFRIAEKIRAIRPDIWIVFTSRSGRQAVDAFAMHAQGYLLKPFEPNRIYEEIHEIHLHHFRSETVRKKLHVKCFGHFEVYWCGSPVIFTRRQSKELFAFLIDREGAACTAEQVAVALWENENDLRAIGHRIRNLVSDIRHTLKKIGFEDVFIREKRQMAVRTDRIICDYYQFLTGDKIAREEFKGEYMVDYSWAEETAASLTFQKEMENG